MAFSSLSFAADSKASVVFNTALALHYVFCILVYLLA